MAGTFQEEYDALSARIGVAYDTAQAKGAAAPMPNARDTYGLSSYINSIPTWHASDYIQNGLILCWDGIENAGRRTHLSDLTSVYDHSGNGYSGTMLSGTVLSDSFVLSGPYAMLYNDAATQVKNAISAQSVTVEVTVQELQFGNDQRSSIWSTTLSGGGFQTGVKAYTVGNFHPSYWCWKQGNREVDSNTLQSGFSLQQNQINTQTYVGKNNGIEVYRDGVLKHSVQIANSNNNTPYSDLICVGGAGSRSTPVMVALRAYCFRVYDRALTSAEVEYNRMVDTLRFNIPSY